ncbi:DUF4191 domain-containing protein [Kineococcus terrestris]|uniref:DUF4191 domain-containing protein n=1 Tax=Kineococcus terrestris TaxID=2044856 RepID=UPI0034DB51F9
MARRTGPDTAPKPKKQRFKRTRQLKQVYDMTVRVDPVTRWWMLLALAVPFVLAIGLGFAFGTSSVGFWIYWAVIGLGLGVLAAMIVLARRAERAAYMNLEGQKGATGAALSSIRRGWNVEQEPVAIDPRSQDMVFRAVGRAGVVLVGDGPPQRVRKLLEAERRKVARVLPNVTVHTFTVGNGGGADEVPLRKVASKVQRLKPVLTKQEVSAVIKRLRALGGIRPPVPQGIDPLRARPDRRAMRGR